MSSIEQNFETTASPRVIHQIPTTRTPLWKILIIWVPVVIFLVLIVAFFFLGSNRPATNTATPAPSPTPTIVSTSPFINGLIQIQSRINSLDLTQPRLTPPDIDLEVSFE